MKRTKKMTSTHLPAADARRAQDKLAAEGYRLLFDDTKAFVEAALPLAKECWPREPWPVGVPGETLLRFAGMIPPDELEQMERDIEEGGGQVDLSQW